MSPEAVIDLPEGTASPPDLATNDPATMAHRDVSQIADGADPEIMAGPELHAGESASGCQSETIRQASARPAEQRVRLRSPSTARGARPASSDWDREQAAAGVARSAPPV